MAIRVREGVFYLETANTLYQMKTDKFGVLNHLWYGAKTDCVMDYLLDYPDVGFSGNIYEAENQRTYSLDTLPLEYASGGVGDFRVPAISVTHGNGSCALDLRFQEYHILKGKYRIPGLPAVYAGEEDAETLEIVLKDTATDVKVILKYGVLEKEDVITRSVVVENQGKTPVTLNRVHSLCMDIPYGEWEWIHFHGRHTKERQAERAELIHGIEESSSGRGMSSHQQNPTFLLCEKGATEKSGFCVGAALMYSGGFQTQIERDQLDQIRIVMGIHPDTFAWRLEAGDSFYAPEVILSCSDCGFAELSHRFHHVIRNNVCRGKYKLSKRPVLINNWEATYFDFDSTKIEEIAKNAAALGIDMMVLDDGWFGKRDSDCSGLGDWVVNEKKLQGGLDRLIQKINGLGMKFGIWMEPEMVSEDSELYRSHPEWAIRIPGRAPMRGRYQLALDMSNPEVISYLHRVISRILRENNIEYVKWDINRSICDWYTPTLPEERQLELPHRYILGLYELLERLTGEFPNILFEGCCGGGGRFDAGMLYYCPQIWCSDDTDAHERTLIQYGTSFFYPISTVGAHVSAVPNHQTGRVTSIRTRGIVAMAGSFGYELDLSTLSAEEKREVRRQVETYKKYQDLIYNGLYYRVCSPAEGNLSVWEFVAKDKSEALVQGLVYRAEPNALRKRVRLTGLDKQAKYRVLGDGAAKYRAVDAGPEMCGPGDTGNVYSGAALMAGGILLPEIKGDDVAVQVYLKKVSAL